MNYKKLVLLGIYLFAFLVPLFPQKIKISVLPVSVDFLIVAYIIFILMLMLFNSTERERLLKSIKEFIHTKLFISVVLFSAACIISIIPAIGKAVTITELIRFWTYIVLFFAVVNFVDNDKDLNNIVSLLVISIAIACCTGLYQYFTHSKEFIDASIDENAGRVYSTFVNPNYWGSFINLVIFPVIVLAIRKVKHYKIFYALFALLLINLILTYTRGSWIGFALGLVLFVILYNKKAIIPIMSLVPLSLVIPGIRKRFISIFDTHSYTIMERFKLWKTGYLMFKEHPIIGVGNGNYLLRYSEYIKRYPELDLGRDKYTVHNSYLKVLAETGIVGLIPFVLVNLFYIMDIICVWRKPRDTVAKFVSLSFLCSMAAYLFQNISNNMFFIPQVNAFYWIIGGLIIVYNNMK